MGAPEGSNGREIIYRIGTFFLLVGIGLMAFFMLSESARQATFEYFCWGLILLILGFVFRGQFRKSTAPSGRFSMVRRLMPKSKKDQQTKK
jgi:predicted membrane channel-forming protein YqfA (hemolysin III family)